MAYSHFIFSNAGANSQQLIGEKIGLVCSFFAIEFACLTAGSQLVPLWNTPIYNTILEAFWHAMVYDWVQLFEQGFLKAI